VFTVALSAALGLALAGDATGFVFTTFSGGHSLDSRAAIRWRFDRELVAELQLGAAPGALADGHESFDDVFWSALDEWYRALEGVAGAPRLFVTPQSTAPKAKGSPFYNNVFFDRQQYGVPFPEDVLAVTLKEARTQDEGYANLVEADIIFNANFRWDSYEGRPREPVYDLYRVALHEIGHFLGLGHPDEASPRQAVTAIMNSGEGGSPLDTLQEDDIRGGRALYALEPPGIPIGHTATASGSVITSNWDHPLAGGEPTGYYVQVGTAPGQTSRTELTGTPRPTLSLGGFAPGTYYVRVMGVNWAGTGAPSRESRVEVTGTGCTRPGTPTVAILSNSGGSFALGWTVPSGNPTGYHLYRATRSIADGELDASFVTRSPLGNANTAMFTNVSPGTYYMRIRGENACGLGPASAQVVVTVETQNTTRTYTYSGRFDGNFQQVLRESRGTCTWQFRYSGRMTLTMQARPDGTITNGTMRMADTNRFAPAGASSNPGGLRCDGANFSDNRSAAITGTLADIRWSDSSWRFTGRRNGNAVTGAMVATLNSGGTTNTGTINVNLPFVDSTDLDVDRSRVSSRR
jgi:hypothetical protein